MTELIAFLSTGKGTWGHINALINGESWDKIILLTNDFGKENFNPNEKTKLLLVDQNLNYLRLRDQILELLSSEIKGTEVAVNFISGNGKEHMAFMSALVKLGVGFRFIVSDDNNVVEI